jgi:hypothetical protein
MPFSLYEQSQLPNGFNYPSRLVDVAGSDAFNALYPWWFIDAKSQAGSLFVGFIEERNLVPFAKTDLEDDIALFDGSDRSGNPKVVMVCSTPERSYAYPDFDAWLAAAIADARRYGTRKA